MSVRWVLLPVFLSVGLTFALLLGMVTTRTRAKKAGGVGNDQFGDCFSNQFELPLLFYVLIALALPLRHVDFVMVLLSWVFVVARFAHAGIFVTSNNLQQRGGAWFAGVLVLFAMWLYFALSILLLI
jgi:hypothetical protein